MEISVLVFGNIFLGFLQTYFPFAPVQVFLHIFDLSKMQICLKQRFFLGANILVWFLTPIFRRLSSKSKRKVSILDSRGLEVGEVECREKEACLSGGGKGTALAVQLRGDQVHCLLVTNISSLNSWAWFGWTLSLFRSNFRQNNFCPLVGNVQNCSFGFGRKR